VSPGTLRPDSAHPAHPGTSERLLTLIARWLASDPAALAPSLLTFIGHPAYGPDALRADLNRFAFLLGGSDGEDLFGQH
jgi:hypothetical protein